MNLKNKYRIYIFTMIFFLPLYIVNVFGAYEIENPWGLTTINDAVVEDLIKSKAVQRQKGIDQSGPTAYYNFVPKFSRYDHSLGVVSLLQQANVSRNEMVAGLFQDASQTAFARLGDYIFNSENITEASYKDRIHLWSLLQMGVDQDLSMHGLDISILDLDANTNYKALEQPLPNLCADRIDYNIRTAYEFKLISKDQAKEMIDHLHFKDDRWYFDDVKIASDFAKLSLHFTKYFWGSPWNYAAFKCYTRVINRALWLELFSIQDLHFGQDLEFINKINASKDKAIIEELNKIRGLYQSYKVVKYGSGELNFKPKFRGIDPLVLNGGTLKKLTALDKNYKNRFESVAKWCKEGYGINFVSVKKAEEENKAQYNKLFSDYLSIE